MGFFSLLALGTIFHCYFPRFVPLQTKRLGGKLRGAVAAALFFFHLIPCSPGPSMGKVPPPETPCPPTFSQAAAAKRNPCPAPAFMCHGNAGLPWNLTSPLMPGWLSQEQGRAGKLQSGSSKGPTLLRAWESRPGVGRDQRAQQVPGWPNGSTEMLEKGSGGGSF